MAAIPAGAGGTKVTSNEELKETAGPVYSDSLAAESQNQGGSFADGESQEIIKPSEHLETSKDKFKNTTDSTHIPTSKSDGHKGDNKITAEAGKRGEGAVSLDQGSEEKSQQAPEHHQEGQSPSGKGIVEHPQHSGAPGPTGTAPGESIEPVEPQHHSSNASHHESHGAHGEKYHNQESSEESLFEEKASHGQRKQDKPSQTEAAQANSEDKQSSSTTNEGHIQGKGIPEHPHPSFAGAPGPTGTAPGEGVESYESLQSDKGHSPKRDNAISHHKKDEDHKAKNLAKLDQVKSDPERQSHEQHHDENTAHEKLNEKKSSHSGSSTPDNKESLQGKGIPEHPHHSVAAAPGPTGTAPGEAIESKTSHQGNKHRSDSTPKEGSQESHSPVQKEHHDTELPQPIDSTTRHQQNHDQKDPNLKPEDEDTSSTGHGDHTQGKGILEQPHHSEAAAPGPTGTAPGEAIDDHQQARSSSKIDEMNSNLSQHEEDRVRDTISNSSQKKDNQSEDSKHAEEHAAHASGKGVPEQKHHFEAGAPGSTGTSPGEEIQAIKDEDNQASFQKKNADGPTELDGGDKVTKTKELDNSPVSKHEKHDSAFDISSNEHDTEHHDSVKQQSKEHHDTSVSGKGILESEHLTAAGAPGTTGTAPGQAIG